MTKPQCQNCKRHSYRDGRCYADGMAGRPVADIVYCWAATPCNAIWWKALKNRGKKTNGNKPNH